MTSVCEHVTSLPNQSYLPASGELGKQIINKHHHTDIILGLLYNEIEIKITIDTVSLRAMNPKRK